MKIYGACIACDGAIPIEDIHNLRSREPCKCISVDGFCPSFSIEDWQINDIALLLKKMTHHKLGDLANMSRDWFLAGFEADDVGSWIEVGIKNPNFACNLQNLSIDPDTIKVHGLGEKIMSGAMTVDDCYIFLSNYDYCESYYGCDDSCSAA